MVKNCQHCAVYDARSEFPEMPQLPLELMDYGCRPFKHVGIDCFGSIYVVQDGRGVKRWGLILTCLTTRAVQVLIMKSMSGADCVANLIIFSNQWHVLETIWRQWKELNLGCEGL